MKAPREADLRMPEDISLVGFDDIDLAEHLVPSLATVHVNKGMLGSVAVQRLLFLVGKPYSINISSVLDLELMIHNSVRQL